MTRNMSKFSTSEQKILGIRFFGRTKDALLKEINQFLVGPGRRSGYIVTPNSEFVVYARKDQRFLEILNQADFSIPDGIGIVWANEVLKGENVFCRIFRAFYSGIKVLSGELTKRRISGADLMIDLVNLARQKNLKIFFLGAARGVAEKAAAKLLGPTGDWSAYSGDSSKKGDSQTVEKIKSAAKSVGGSIDLLFVAYGMGKQEYWLDRNLKKIPVKLAMGVGGSFDYIAGTVSRAPKWIQQVGLEWLYRLIKQPWRIRRQINLLYFIFLVIFKGDR